MNSVKSKIIGAVTLLFLVAFILGGCARDRRARDYRFDYSTLPNFSWKRVTSVDPEGFNVDNVRVNPGETVVLGELDGPGEISRLWLTWDSANKSYEHLVLEIFWEDTAEPSVRAPISLFFGVANRRDVEVENDFLHVAKTQSLNSFFPMPFRRKARLQIRNDSTEIVAALYWYIEYKKFDSPRSLDGKMYFHAHYRQGIPVPNREPYLVLDAEGPGVFLGSTLAVAVNSYGWWGEGDDIFTIDGVRTKGTGSEDYYGGAWGWAFQPARGVRFGVPIAESGLDPGGLWLVYRFHSEAPIRFRDRLRFELETGYDGYNGREPLPNNYYSVAFYYKARPEGQPPLPPLAERLIRNLPLPIHQPGEPLEVETLMARGRIYSVNGGQAGVRSVRSEESKLYSGGADVLLTAFKSGTRFLLPIEFPEGGTFLPKLVHTVSPQGLMYDLYLNGRLWMAGLNAYGERREPVELELPAVHLPAGTAIMEVVVTGSDERAQVPALFIGLDRLQFSRSDEKQLVDFTPDSPVPTAGRLLLAPAQAPGAGALVDSANQSIVYLVEGDVTFERSGSDGETILQFGAQGGGRVVTESPVLSDAGSQFQFEAWIRPSHAGAKRQQLFSRNLVAGSYLENGRLVFWLRDSEFRFLFIQTDLGAVPADAWSHVRLTLDGTVARIHLNGALLRILDMQTFQGLNSYPGRTVIGNTEELTAPFVGAMRGVRFSAGQPRPAAGESLPAASQGGP